MSAITLPVAEMFEHLATVADARKTQFNDSYILKANYALRLATGKRLFQKLTHLGQGGGYLLDHPRYKSRGGAQYHVWLESELPGDARLTLIEREDDES